MAPQSQLYATYARCLAIQVRISNSGRVRFEGAILSAHTNKKLPHLAKQNAFICPAGQTLTPIRQGKLRELKKVEYGNAKACPPVETAASQGSIGWSTNSLRG